MKFYSFLRQYFNPSESGLMIAMWYAFLIFLIFLGLAGHDVDLRYANL